MTQLTNGKVIEADQALADLYTVTGRPGKATEVLRPVRQDGEKSE